MLRSFVLVCLLISGALAVPAQYKPPAGSAKALSGIDFSKAVAIDEAYRKTFEDCDRNGKCKTDPNNFRAFLKFQDGTVFYESKMSLDLDGSWKACGCGIAGKSDQCRTTHLWDPKYPSDEEYFAEKDRCRFYREQAFVDAENFPYMVIPSGSKFGGMTGLAAGDLGVVIYGDRVVPVFVADTGPTARIGEGSAALMRGLGVDRCLERNTDGHCTKYNNSSIEEKVLFFVFPKSKIKGLQRETALKTVSEKALKRFDDLIRSVKKNQ